MSPFFSLSAVSALTTSSLWRTASVPNNAAASRSVKPARRNAREISAGSVFSTSNAGAMPRFSASARPPLLTALILSRRFGASVRPSCTEISGPPTAATASAPESAIKSASVSAFVRLSARCDSCSRSTASRSSPYAAPGSWIDAATVPSGPPFRVFSSYERPSRIASKKNDGAMDGSLAMASRTRVRHLAMAAFFSSWSP
mmetsp:Transcript_28935/g.89431  ORF Transcript_28935/g.89431 Transcript_28935/m.89431 type:complete len:201 (-) Transcript_28935:364-966(-)